MDDFLPGFNEKRHVLSAVSIVLFVIIAIPAASVPNCLHACLAICLHDCLSLCMSACLSNDIHIDMVKEPPLKVSGASHIAYKYPLVIPL